MSRHTATTRLNREHIHAEAYRARAAHDSRYDISVLALELLRDRHRTRHFTSDKAKQKAMLSIDERHSENAARLAFKHEKEATELEDARFALFEEFDTKREAWATTTKRLLQEQDSKYAEAFETLMAQNVEEDRTTQWWLSQEQERDRRHSERFANLDVAWKLRQAELRKQLRRDRFKIEDEYPVRLVELRRSEEVISLRQAEELQALARERESAHIDVLAAFDVFKAELQDERRRVEEWWSHLNKDAAACRRQIDRDEQCALDEIGLLESAEVNEEKKLSVAVNTQCSVTSDRPAPGSPQRATATGSVQAVAATTAVEDVAFLAEVNRAHRRKKDQVDITIDWDAEGGPVTYVPQVEVADSEATPLIVDDGDRAKAIIDNHTSGAEPLLVPPTLLTNEERFSFISDSLSATSITTQALAEVEGCQPTENRISDLFVQSQRSSLHDSVSCESDCTFEI